MKFTDLTGQKFSKLTVIERAANNLRGEAMWICQCDCGNITRPIRTSALTHERTKSCGCLKNISHNRTHNKSGTRLYFIWRDMLNRCYNPNIRDYPTYGGDGIIVCHEWHSFESFNDWAMVTGYDETAERGKCTLDRVDPNGNYCPENCRWATIKEQQNNKRNNHLITYNEKTQTLAQWAEEYKIPYGTLWKRLKMGWDIKKALTTEVGKTGYNK